MYATPQRNAGAGDLYIDNITIVPEPSSLGLMTISAVTLAMPRRTKKTANK
ncbi:MAG: PEP-CTERM sorting domain-containing protein [Chthoniobacterales bacterium]